MMETKKIRFEMSGGLGSQLFEYAALMYLREKFHDVEVNVDFSQFRFYRFHNGVELQKILLTDLDKEIAAIMSEREKGLQVEKPLRKFLYNFLEKAEGYKTFYDDNLNTPKLMDNVVNYNQRMIFDGRYLTCRFVELVSHSLRKKVIDYTPEELGTRNADLLRRLRGTTSIGVHIRRGDYADGERYDVFGDMSYFGRAMNLMHRQENAEVFVVFSNDIDWARRFIPEAYQCVFVDWNRGEDSYRDMVMMSKCTHNIICNSSFGWWGAWLNDNPQKKVIAPRRWFADLDGSEVAPKGWTLLDNER